MYGIQTLKQIQWNDGRFENDVKMYGIQTRSVPDRQQDQFENDVKMYGIQTSAMSSLANMGLRMM